MGGRKEQVVHGFLFICICTGLGRLSGWAVKDMWTIRGRPVRLFLPQAGSGWAEYEALQVGGLLGHPHVSFTSQRPQRSNDSSSRQHIVDQPRLCAEVTRGQLAGARSWWEPNLRVQGRGRWDCVQLAKESIFASLCFVLLVV